MLLPPEFATSYKDFTSYPLNVVQKGAYHYALESRQSRLHELAPKLFTQDPQKIDVRFRDTTANRQGQLNPEIMRASAYTQMPTAFERDQIVDDNQLKKRLGDGSVRDPQTALLAGDIATKRDPTCRFMYNGKLISTLTKLMLVAFYPADILEMH